MTPKSQADASRIAKRWSPSQIIAVLCAVDDDYKANEMNGRDDLECPVCKKPQLLHRRANMFDMTAWCASCETGITQGFGAK